MVPSLTKTLTCLSITELLAHLFALCAGFALAFFYINKKKEKERRQKFQRCSTDNLNTNSQSLQNKKFSITEYVVSYLKQRTKAVAVASYESHSFKNLFFFGSKNLDTLICRTGLATQVSREGVCDARLRLMACVALIGILLGSIFSEELAFVGLLLGGIGAWLLPKKVLQHLEKKRKLDLEAHLSEMLEVVALGLRSGLSFDSSFELYQVYFTTDLALASASAQRQWQLGLRTREEALRDLASSYNSTLFSRVIESIIRSIRFGTSLADSFDSAALEARLIHKAEREEAVAKAPVKMLVPTAALILPAMLILVLGPILLEVTQGF